MKYEIGDTVTIRKDLKGGDKYGYCLFTEEMEKYRGKTTTIKGYHEDSPNDTDPERFTVSTDNEYWSWSPRFFEVQPNWKQRLGDKK